MMKILVVEDEHKIANALGKALEHENHTVDIVFNGDEGLAMATTGPYDLVILDRMLPGEHDGIGIVKSMRNEKVFIPVLMLTGMDTDADKRKGLDSGADDYMTKPFSLNELLARVHALLRRSNEYDAPADPVSGFYQAGMKF